VADGDGGGRMTVPTWVSILVVALLTMHAAGAMMDGDE
jgi:hypothetical protein